MKISKKVDFKGSHVHEPLLNTTAVFENKNQVLIEHPEGHYGSEFVGDQFNHLSDGKRYLFVKSNQINWHESDTDASKTAASEIVPEPEEVPAKPVEEVSAIDDANESPRPTLPQEDNPLAAKPLSEILEELKKYRNDSHETALLNNAINSARLYEHDRSVATDNDKKQELAEEREEMEAKAAAERNRVNDAKMQQWEKAIDKGLELGILKQKGQMVYGADGNEITEREFMANYLLNDLTYATSLLQAISSKEDNSKAEDTEPSPEPKAESLSKKAYEKALIEVKGIGEKSAKDIMKVYPKSVDLANAIASGEELPFTAATNKALAKCPPSQFLK